MQEPTLIAGEDIAWTPHPQFANVCLAWLMRRSADTPPLSCALVEMPPEAEVPEHIHAHDDDILYVLRGRALMWIEGRGDIPLETGGFCRIPAGTRHRPHSFSGGFLAFNIWAAHPELERAVALAP
jgi:mannose-6-phosphate isomerase-like protein (cupin superfamily)